VTTYLLDTTVLIDFLGGASKAVSLVKELSEEEHELCTCCVCVTELYSGLSADAASTADELLDNLTYLDVTRDQARLAGSMRYQYARRGISLSTTDTIIAAVAVANDATLVTANVRDFPLEELQLLELRSS
jgi:predicted nucleic acid-binding protein